MTVAELMAVLKTVPPETRVLVYGYEGGWEDPDKVEVKSMLIDVRTPSYYGPHDIDESGRGPKAVLIYERGSIYR